MWQLIVNIIHDPIYGGLALTALSWLGTKVWSLLSASNQNTLELYTRYAEDAAAWALVHFPGLSAAELATKAGQELDTILERIGIKLSADDKGHMVAIIQGFIARQLLTRGKPAS